MNFELYLRQLLAGRRERFTCLIGTEFNHRCFPPNNILASWKLLCGRVLGVEPEGEHPARAVERYLSAGAAGASVRERARALALSLRQQVDWETERQLRAPTGCFPEGIIDPDWVSDIVSLNIDEWVERYCRTWLGLRVSGWRLPAGFEGRQGFGTASLRYRELRFPGRGAIRIWHLHGCVARPAGLLPGKDPVTARAGLLEALRRHHASPADGAAASPTWYGALRQPVLFLGTSLPASEAEVWAALSDREALSSAPGRRRPLFRLGDPAEEGRPDGFLPVYDMGDDLAVQWERLEEVLRRSKARWPSA